MALTNELAQALQALGFTPMGAVFTGVWRGYAVSVYDADNRQTQIEFAVRIDKKNNAPAAAAGQALRAAGLRAAAQNKGSSVVFQPRFDKKSPPEQQMRQFLESAASGLAGGGAAPAATCALCGGAAPESLCWLGSWQPVHAGCVHDRTVKTREAAEHNRLNGSYLTGVVGGLLGAVVGMIPSLLTILFLNRVAAILFALIPLAAMWGYRKLGGRQDRGAIAIVIVLSILSVPIMTTLVASIQAAQETGMPFGTALGAILAYVVTGEGFAALLADSLTEFLFLALGILAAWRLLKQTAAGDVKLAEAAEASVRPNPMYMAQSGKTAAPAAFSEERETL